MKENVILGYTYVSSKERIMKGGKKKKRKKLYYPRYSEFQKRIE